MNRNAKVRLQHSDWQTWLKAGLVIGLLAGMALVWVKGEELLVPAVGVVLVAIALATIKVLHFVFWSSRKIVKFELFQMYQNGKYREIPRVWFEALWGACKYATEIKNAKVVVNHKLKYCYNTVNLQQTLFEAIHGTPDDLYTPVGIFIEIKTRCADGDWVSHQTRPTEYTIIVQAVLLNGKRIAKAKRIVVGPSFYNYHGATAWAEELSQQITRSMT